MTVQNELATVSPLSWLKIVVYSALLTGMYFTTYAWLISVDWAREDYGASMLIPLVVLYLVWEKRALLTSLPSVPSWTGLVIVIAGVALFWLGELAGEFFSLYFSSWLLLVGLCWLHLGRRKVRILAFPLGLCLAMFPLPNFIHGKLSFNLKLISSRLGVTVMQWMGMSSYREGNVIDLGFTQLQVVDACNGLRYLIPLIILGLMIAYFYKTAWWKRAVLVLSTIPIAVVVNSLRIASVGIFYQLWGPLAAEGFFHDFSGWFIFMLTLGFLLVVMWILKKLPPAAPAGGPGAGIRDANPVGDRPHEAAGGDWVYKDRYFMAAGILLVVTLALSYGVDFQERVPIGKSFAEFPLKLGQWRGKPKPMGQAYIDALDFSDYAMIDYRNRSGKNVNFYAAYYQSQRKGESIHSPATCLPGSGWVFHQRSVTDVPIRQEGKGTLPVRRALMQKGSAKQLVYYWFPMRGRVLTNAYEMKLFNFWDALTRQRTDGALVRLITPVYAGESVETAEARLLGFTGDIVPQLNEFLPR